MTQPLHVRRLELAEALAPLVDRLLADPVLLGDFRTGDASASRRIFTICSSVNRVFFMASSLPWKPSSQESADPKIAGQVSAILASGFPD
jgi:hypothetical protein